MNKRPLPCVLAGFVLGEVWIWQFHGTAAWAALCLAAIICFMIGVFKKGSFFILLSLGLFIGSTKTWEWNQNKIQIAQWRKENTCLIQGQIEEVTENEYSYSVVIGKLKIKGSPCKGKLMIYLDEEPQCYIGCGILLKGRIEEFKLPTNPGGFNLRFYRESKGIIGVVTDAEIKEVRMGGFLIKDGIYSIREKASDYIKENMKENYAGIGIAMAFGNKDYIPEEQKSLYEFGGISHVLAVSGLHMSLLGAAIYKLLRKIGLGYSVSVFASVPCILIYTVMSGMSTSCLRAAMMLCIYLIAEWKGYYYDLPSALSLAAIWLLYEIPVRLFDSGFLLSFGAMISVGILCPFIFNLFQYKTGKNKIKDSFLSGLMITLFTIPLSLYFFYGFSMAGLLLNLIVIPLMTFLVPVLFLGGMGCFSFVPNIFSIICLKMAEWILWIYDVLCNLVHKIPFSYFQAGYRGLYFAICYYIILSVLIGILFCIFRKNKKLTYVILPFLLGGILIFICQTGRKDAYLSMLDVGQGDGILYHSDSGEVCMFDGGSTSEKNIGTYVIRPALEYYGISKVDYWMISHFDADHLSGLEEMLESGYPIANLILPFRKEKGEKQKEIEDLAQKNHTDIHYMKQGDRISLENSILYCLYPQKNSIGDENQNSMVLLLDTPGQQILLTGDVEKDGETAMTNYLKKYNLNEEKEQILKTGHHGSSNGTREELLKAFKPDTALVSCAYDNSYGHPAADTIDRIKNSGAAIYYTMKHGAIEIRLGKETSYLGYGVVNYSKER